MMVSFAMYVDSCLPADVARSGGSGGEGFEQTGMLYYTLLYSTLLYSTLLYSTIRFYYIASCYVILSYTIRADGDAKCRCA